MRFLPTFFRRLPWLLMKYPTNSWSGHLGSDKKSEVLNRRFSPALYYVPGFVKKISIFPSQREAIIGNIFDWYRTFLRWKKAIDLLTCPGIRILLDASNRIWFLIFAILFCCLVSHFLFFDFHWGNWNNVVRNWCLSGLRHRYFKTFWFLFLEFILAMVIGVLSYQLFVFFGYLLKGVLKTFVCLFMSLWFSSLNFSFSSFNWSTCSCSPKFLSINFSHLILVSLSSPFSSIDWHNLHFRSRYSLLTWKSWDLVSSVCCSSDASEDEKDDPESDGDLKVS